VGADALAAPERRTRSSSSGASWRSFLPSTLPGRQRASLAHPHNLLMLKSATPTFPTPRTSGSSKNKAEYYVASGEQRRSGPDARTSRRG